MGTGLGGVTTGRARGLRAEAGQDGTAVALGERGQCGAHGAEQWTSGRERTG